MSSSSSTSLGRRWPQRPQPDKAKLGHVTFSLAAVHAFLITGKSLVFSESMLQDSADNILQWYKNKKITSDEYEASIKYGKQIAVAVMQWAAQDHYRQTVAAGTCTALKEAQR